MKLLLLLLLVVGAAGTDPAPARPSDGGADTDAPSDTEPPADACGPERGLARLEDALDRIGQAATDRDIAAFAPAWTEARDQLDCLQVVVPPRIAAAVHAANYLDLAARGDRDAMAAALLAARSVPGAAPPEWLWIPGPGDPGAAGAITGVDPPAGVALFVDGSPATTRPVDRAAIYQAVGGAGEVLWSAWLQGDEDLPDGFVAQEVQPGTTGAEELAEVTALLGEGRYQEVLDRAIPAVARYPDLGEGFLAAADLAADQIRRARLDSARIEALNGYGPRRRRGAARRGDPRRDFLLGFDLGLPSSIHGELKLGGAAVDGIGLRIGAGAMLYGGSSLYTGVDASVYLDWNLTRRWQLQTNVLGVFVDSYGSPYAVWGVGVQYDPPNPLEVTVGVKAGFYHVGPTATVGFLW